MLLLKSFIASEFGSVDRALIQKKTVEVRPQLAERAFTFIVRPYIQVSTP
jgi:hypothetical protein